MTHFADSGAAADWLAFDSSDEEMLAQLLLDNGKFMEWWGYRAAWVDES